MYNTANPAELYPNTTWELLPDNKFLKTGATPLQSAGTNSIKISKANLPAEKLQVESHSHTQPTHYHSGPNITRRTEYKGTEWGTSGERWRYLDGNTTNAGGENTSSSAPYTTAMGSGTPLTINPEHITIKAWKRLS